MSRAKRYSEAEIANISKNFIYITQKCPLSVSELANGPDGHIVSKNTYNRLYSPATFKGWCPQERILREIVKYFNKYFLPPITLQELVNNSLSTMEFAPKKEESLNWYEGIYFCYYLNASGKHFNFGILRIYRSDNLDYNCEAIMGLEEEQYENLKKIVEIFDIEQSLELVYNNYISTPSDNKEFQSIAHIAGTYFSGLNVVLSSRAVTLSLTNHKNSFLRIITFNRYDGANREHYQGSIGSMMTTTTYDKPTIFKNIGLSSIDIGKPSDKLKNWLKLNVDSEIGVIANDNEKASKSLFNTIRGKISMLQKEQIDNPANES